MNLFITYKLGILTVGGPESIAHKRSRYQADDDNRPFIQLFAFPSFLGSTEQLYNAAQTLFNFNDEVSIFIMKSSIFFFFFFIN